VASGQRGGRDGAGDPRKAQNEAIYERPVVKRGGADFVSQGSRTSPSPSASVDLAHLRPVRGRVGRAPRDTSSEPEAEGDCSPSMPAVYEALAERDVIRSTIYSGSTGLPDVAIKPEYKGRHHSIARQPAMGPLSGFVAGSSSWSSRPPAFARQVARSHRGWVRFTSGSRSFPGSRRPATWLRFPSQTISSPASSSWAWGPWSAWLRSCTESTS